jgi:hypothetical protein
LGDPCVDGRTIRNRVQGVDSISMAQDTDQWKALVNTAMNHQVSRKMLKLLAVLASAGASGRLELVRYS